MGTSINIYLKRKVKEKELEELKKLTDDLMEDVKKGNFSCSSSWELSRFLKVLEHNTTVHICKISAGWQLLFQSYPGIKSTLENLLGFIKEKLDSGEWELKDEYSGDYSVDQLLEDIESHKDGWTRETYCKETGERYRKDGEFISDNLRWCKSDFFLIYNMEALIIYLIGYCLSIVAGGFFKDEIIKDGDIFYSVVYFIIVGLISFLWFLIIPVALSIYAGIWLKKMYNEEYKK